MNQTTTTSAPLSKFIKSYPMLFGAFLGLLGILAVIVIQTWFPWVGEGLGRHKTLAQAVFCTSFAFGVFVYVFQRWRAQNSQVFWASLFVFFLLHSLGVFLYSVRVGPIRGWQWIILLYLEGYVGAFFVGWSTHRWPAHRTKTGGRYSSPG